MSIRTDSPQPEDYQWTNQERIVGWLLISTVVGTAALVWLQNGGIGWMEVHGQTSSEVARVIAAFIPALIVAVAYRVYLRDQWWKRAEWALEAASADESSSRYSMGIQAVVTMRAQGFASQADRVLFHKVTEVVLDSAEEDSVDLAELVSSGEVEVAD